MPTHKWTILYAYLVFPKSSPQTRSPFMNGPPSMLTYISQFIPSDEEQYDPGVTPLDPQPADPSTANSSTPGSPQKERVKRPQADKVYTVATDRTIKTLMTEYKKRKQAHSMPTFVRAQRSKPAAPKVKKSLSADPIDKEIQDQQINSIMKVGSL